MNDSSVNTALSQNDLLVVFQKALEKKDEENKSLVEVFHEEIGAELMALKLKLAQHEISKDLKEYFGQSISTIVQKIKKSSNELFPMALEQIGLEEAVRVRTRKFSEDNNINIEVLKICQDKIKLSAKKATAIFFMFEEIMKNCISHSNCHEIQIVLKSNKPFQMDIRDDGKGFEFKADCLFPEHSGLNEVVSRAKSIQADIKFMKLSNEGSIVKIEINE